MTSNGKAIFTISYLNGITAGVQRAWATCFYSNSNKELLFLYGTAYFKSDYLNTATEIIFFLQSKVLMLPLEQNCFPCRCSLCKEKGTSFFDIILYSIIVYSKLWKVGHFQTGQWWWSSSLEYIVVEMCMLYTKITRAVSKANSSLGSASDSCHLSADLIIFYFKNLTIRVRPRENLNLFT